MMSKEFLKKLGIFGVTMGLTASPLVLAQQTQQDEYQYESNDSAQQSQPELDEGADNLPGTQEDPVDRTFDKTEEKDTRQDAADEPDELDVENGVGASDELDEGADNLPGTQEDPVDRTFDKTEEIDTQQDAADVRDETDPTGTDAAVGGDVGDETDLPGDREDPLERTFDKTETEDEDMWDE